MVGKTKSSILFTVLLLYFTIAYCSLLHKEADPVELKIGEAIQAIVEKDAYSYYKISEIPELGEENLVIQTTPLSGYVDLYISNDPNNPNPTKDRYTWKSTEVGSNFIYLNKTVAVAPLFIGIYGYQRKAQFTIIAYITGGHVTTVDGLPQTTRVEVNERMYYKYFLEKDGAFTISLAAVYGDPDIFVSIDNDKPSRDNYTWGHRDFGSDIITITPDHPAYRYNVWYYIGIEGWTTSLYNMVVSHEDTITILGEGVPSVDMLPQNKRAYFKFNLLEALNITFTVTPKSTGDPDMYISTVHERPDEDHCEWRSIRYGADTITITTDDPNYKVSTYYVGIKAYTDTTFTMLVTTDTHTMLVPGRTQFDVIEEARKARYYMFHLDPIHDSEIVDFTAFPITGSLNMYSSRTNRYPTDKEGEYEKKGRIVDSASVITYEVSTDTWFYLVVYAETPGVSYAITAAPSTNPVILEHGVTHTYTVRENKIKTFIFDMESKDEEIVVTFRNIDGNAELYMDVEPNPTRENHTWSITSGGSSSLYIDPSHPKRKPNQRFYISVYGSDYSISTFSLGFSTTNATITLINRVPHAGFVKSGVCIYYRYFLEKFGEVRIRLSGEVGDEDADLYVSKTKCDQRPDRYCYEWRSISATGPDIVTIHNATAGYYYICVYGWTDAHYVVSASSDYEYLPPTGEAMIDTVHEGDYRYYRITLDRSLQSEYFFIGFTLISGTCQIFANPNLEDPTRENSRYNSTVGWPGKYLLLDRSAPDFTYGTWTVAIYGVQNSHYLFHASLEPWQNALQPGVPALGVVLNGKSTVMRMHKNNVDRGNYFFYYRDLNNQKSQVTIYADQSPNTHPNATNYKWKISGNDNMILNLTDTAPDREIFVSIFGESETGTTRFIGTLVRESDPIYLTQEQPQRFITPAFKAAYYEVSSSFDQKLLTVYSESCDNNPPPTLYLSRYIRYPNKTTAETKSELIGDFTQRALHPAAQLHYIGLDVYEKERTYEIYPWIIHDYRPTPREDGKLQLGNKISPTEYELIIPTATGQGPFTYKVYGRKLNPEEDLHTVNMETYCSVSKIGELLATLTAPDDPPRIIYNLVVESDVKYAVNVIVEGRHGVKKSYKPLLVHMANRGELTLGFSTYGNVSRNGYEYFVLPSIPQLRDDNYLVFALSPLAGDPDLYISVKAPPTKDDYTWVARQAGADILRVSKKDGNYTTGPYYVGVYGNLPSIYTVIAYISDEHVTVNDATPQVSHVKNGESVYFKFNLDVESNFTVGVTPLHGDPDIYICNEEERPGENATWVGTNAGLDVVNILSTHPKFKVGTYYMTVKGHTESVFSLTATKEDSQEILTQGVPHGREVNANSWVFFRFRNSFRSDIWLSVDVLHQNEDLSVCVSASQQKPTDNCDWKGDTFDRIIIPSNDPKYKIGWYYVGVQNYQEEEIIFKILYTTAAGASVLQEGQPETVIALADEYRYFRMHYGYSETTLTFTAEINGGDADLYVSSEYDNTRPTKDKHEFKSIVQGNRRVVSITPSIAKIGWYFVGAHAKVDSNFTIVGDRSQRSFEILNGKIVENNYVPRGYYKYFDYNLLTRPMGKKVTIILQSFRPVSPSIYVDINPRPTRENHRWKAEYPEIDPTYITIPAEELDQLDADRLYIGVMNRFQDSYYSIILYLSDTTIDLEDGRPIPGAVSTGSYNYYKYALPSDGRIIVSVKPTSKYAAQSLYLKREEKPTKDNYDYKSEVYAGENIIRLNNRQKGTYYLGVLGVLDGSYVIKSTTENDYIYDGDTIQDWVRGRRWRHFRGYVDWETRSLTVSVTLITGYTELYVNSNTTLPTRRNYTWSATAFRGNTLTINSRDKGWQPGEWTFSVYGAQDSEFFITVHSGHGELKPGVPRAGSIVYPRTMYFMYTPKANMSHYFTLKALGDGCANIYMSQTNLRPNATTATWKDTTSPKLMNQALLRLDRGSIRREFPIFIAVQSCLRDRRATRFQISVTDENEPFYINQDLYLIYSQQSRFRRSNNNFAVRTAYFSRSVMMYLDLCYQARGTRTATIYAGNSSYNYPLGPGNYQYISESIGDYTESIQIRNPTLNSVYKMTIYTDAVFRESLYSMFVTTRNEDPRPKCSHFQKTTTKKDKDKRTVTFTLDAIRASNYPLYYDIVAIDADKSINQNSNFDTLCGLHSAEDLLYLKRFSVNRAYRMEMSIDFDLNTTWVVNVIITNNLGMQSVCKSIILKPDHYYEPIYFPVSVGGILILLAIIALITYLVVGAIFKKVKYGATGIDLIPNVDFWKELPFLVKDGIIYAIRCGKRESYTEFVNLDAQPEEQEQIAHSGQLTLNAPTEDIEKTASAGTYGAI